MLKEKKMRTKPKYARFFIEIVIYLQQNAFYIIEFTNQMGGLLQINPLNRFQAIN